VRALNSRAIMPLKVRGPSLPSVSVPGAALLRATRSSIDVTGESALTSTANGLRAMKATGTKSFAGS
jgi:hypothetical protein